MFPRRASRKSQTPNLDRAIRLSNSEPVDPSRRKAIKILAGSALAISMANRWVTTWASEAYRSNGTELSIVGGNNIKSNLFAISFGGEGNYNDYYGATSLFKASDRRIPTANMIYNNKDGLNFDDMARVMRKAQQERGFQYLVINGDSLGAMFGLFAALRAGIPVAGFIINSGPEQLGDAQGGAVLTADFVTSPINPRSQLVETTELALKDLWCYFRDNSFGSAIEGLPHELFTLPDQMAEGGSPQLQRSQLSWAKRIDFEELAPEYERRGIVSKYFTRPVFLQAASDNVIHPHAAYEDWNHKFFHPIGIHMPLLHMGPNSSHADVFTEAAPLRAYGYFDDLIAQFDPPLPHPGGPVPA